MEGSVRKRGEKWYYSFELAGIGGKRKRVERAGGRTKKEAEAALRKALEEYEATGQAFRPSTVSMADYLDYWLKEYAERECKEQTYLHYKSMMYRHVRPQLGSYRLSALTPLTITALFNDLNDGRMSYRYMQNIYRVLALALKMAVHPYQFLVQSPMAYTKIPRDKGRSAVKADAARNEAVRQLYAKWPEIYAQLPLGNPVRLPACIAFYTALRAGEACALLDDDIDLDNLKLTVSKTLIAARGGFKLGTPKTTESERTVLFGENFKAIIKEHKKWMAHNRLVYGPHYTVYYKLDGDDMIYAAKAQDALPSGARLLNFLCVRENGSIVKPSAMHYWYTKISKQYGLRFKLHNLRHVHAVTLDEAGVNLRSIQARLGHTEASATTAKVYLHETERMARQAVDAFEASLPTAK